MGVVTQRQSQQRIFGSSQMTNSKLSRWVKRGAFMVIAFAAFTMISAEQAQAQYYGGGRGISIGSYGGGGGISLSIGNSGFNRGSYYGGYGRGYSGYGGGYGRGYSGYRYAPQKSYYRGGGSYGRGSYYGGRRY